MRASQSSSTTTWCCHVCVASPSAADVAISSMASLSMLESAPGFNFAMKKMPPSRMLRISFLVKIASIPRPPPSASAPRSPMKTCAG